MAKNRTLSKARISFLILLFGVCSQNLWGQTTAKDEFFTIQVTAFQNVKTLFGYAHLFQKNGFDKTRIEKEENLFFLKIGKTKNKIILENILTEINLIFPDAFIKKETYRAEKQIYPFRTEKNKLSFQDIEKDKDSYYFTLQLLSSKQKENAFQYAKYLEQNAYQDFWIEKIAEYYVLRLAKTHDLKKLVTLQKKLEKAYPSAFILFTRSDQQQIITGKTKNLYSDENEIFYYTISVTNSRDHKLSSIIETAHIFQKNGFPEVQILQDQEKYFLDVGKSSDKRALFSQLNSIKILYPNAVIIQRRKKFPQIKQNLLDIYGKRREQSIFTIQLLSTNSLKKAEDYSQFLHKKNLQNFWIEKINEFFVLRLGISYDLNKLAELKENIIAQYPTCFIRLAYFFPNKILYPEDHSKFSVPPKTASLSKTKAPIVKQIEAREKANIPKSFSILPQNKFLRKEISLKQFENSSPSLLYISILLFLALLTFPFMPGIIEYFKKRDILPLFIEMNYTKEPRFFDRSFRQKILKAVKMIHFEHTENVTLSKPETVEIIKSARIREFNESDRVLYILDDLKTIDNMVFVKEIYVVGNAILGENNFLRSLMTEKDLVLQKNSTIVRWLGANGDIFIEENCDLGVQVSSSKILKIGRNCKFRRLFGNPIITYNGYEREVPLSFPIRHKNFDPKKVNSITDMDIRIEKDDCIINSNEYVDKDLVVYGNIQIYENAEINGTIKSYGKVTLQDSVKMRGNIFAEAGIEIGFDCVIDGDIFSHQNVRIESGSIIGKKNAVKSVIGKMGVQLAENVVIYGYILNEEEGFVF